MEPRRRKTAKTGTKVVLYSSNQAMSGLILSDAMCAVNARLAQPTGNGVKLN
jgi:hypothetical protein